MKSFVRPLQEIRDDFPILKESVHGHPLIYFDNAATTQKPAVVIDSISRFYETYNSNVHRGFHELSRLATDAYEEARVLMARFLNALPEEIVFTSGTTQSINLVAYSWGEDHIQEGDVILLSELEHHSNLIPWQQLAKRKHASLRFIPITPEGVLDLTDIESLFDERVRLLSLTHISNALGTITPCRELCARARAFGAVSLIDAAQSAGHQPVDVRQIGCDFLALSGHKMCGPTGIGILFADKSVAARMRPFQFGGEMISSVEYQESTFKQPPHRFEAGTPPIAEAIGLAAAVKYLEEVGRKRIAQHDAELTNLALDCLSEIPGLSLLGPKEGRAGIVSFVLQGTHAHDAVSLADNYGLALRGGHHCAQPLHKKLRVPASCRASFYFYNTEAEIRRMAEIIRKIQTFFS